MSDTPRPLNREQAARVNAAGDAFRDIAAAIDSGRPDDIAAALAAARQAARQVDMEAFINALHVPDDAGVWAPELRAMLMRIPDGWGRWIRCGRGWYPILARMHERMIAVAPDYELHQVKEKYGTLRVYWEDAARVDDPADPEPAFPGRDAPEALRTAHQAEWEAWWDRRDAWAESPAGAAAHAAQAQRAARVAAIIAEAEAAAERTCEDCGNAGSLRQTFAVSCWYRTLCAHCAGHEYGTREQWEVWWAAYEPTVLAERRERYLTHVAAHATLVATTNPAWDLPGAHLALTPDEVTAALAAGGVEEVLLGDDACGRAAVAWLAARYADHERWVPFPGREEYRRSVAPPGAPRYARLPGELNVAALEACGFERSRYPGARSVYGITPDGQ